MWVNDNGAWLYQCQSEEHGGWMNAQLNESLNTGWNHLVGTYDGNVMKLYKNGVKVATYYTSDTPITGGTDLFIGGSSISGDNFGGIIDEVAVYNRALSAGEVSEHYVNGIPKPAILINLGSEETTDTAVTLNLYATDDESGVAQMQFSNQFSQGWTAWENYTTTKDWTLDATPGRKTVYVRYKDGAGNESIVYTDKIDLNSYEIQAVADPEGSATFSFSPAAPNNLYEAGTDVWATVTPGSGWTFVNWTGDASGPDNTVAVTMDGDKTVTANMTDVTPPVSSVTDPPGGMTLPSPLSHYTIRGTSGDSGGSGVDYVDVSIDCGTTWHRANGTDSWSYQWVPSANGTYDIVSRATDAYGNEETPGACMSVTLDNAPVSIITAPADLEAVHPSDGSYKVTGTTRDYSGTGLTGAEVSTDGGSSWNSATNDSGDWTGWSYVLTPLPLGSHTIQARATDATPKTETPSQSVTLIVDGSAPTVTIDDPTEGQEIELSVGTYVITGTATDLPVEAKAGVKTVLVTTDGGSTWQEATGKENWSFDWAPPGLGSYSIQARAIDKVDNWGGPSGGVSVNVVNNPHDFLWTRMNGTVGTDRAMDVATDASGNSYSVGYTGGSFAGYTSAGGADIFITKYDAGGNRLWTIQDGTPKADYGMGICLDPSGNIYITGYTYGDIGGIGSNGDPDAFAIKYDSSGSKIWTYQEDSPGFGTYGRAIGVGSDGKAYIAGYAKDYDGIVIGLDQEGAETEFEYVSYLGISYLLDIAVVDSRNVYVVGYEDNTDYNIVVAKLDFDLYSNIDWVKATDDVGNEIGFGIALDDDGNVVIAGCTDSSVDGYVNAGEYDPFSDTYPYDIVVYKYDANGNKIWSVQSGTPESDVAYGVDTDSFGSIYVSGYTEGAFTGYTNMGGMDVFVKRYNSLGADLWSAQMGVPGNDIALKVSVDTNDMVYIAGGSYGDLEGNTNQGANDMFVSKLGEELSSVITDPSDGQVVSTSSYLITGMAVDYSINSVQAVEVSTDGGATWNVADDTSGDGSWSTWVYADWTSLSVGSYNLRSRATNDIAETEVPGVGVFVTVDNVPPVTDYTYPLTGAVLNGANAVLTGTGADAGTRLTGVDISYDGGANWYAATDTSGDGTWSTWSYGWALSVDDVYTLKSRGADVAGNVETPSAGETVTVDNTPPASAVTDPVDGALISGVSYTLNCTASDNLSGVYAVEVSTDGGSNWSFANYTGGVSWSYDWTLPSSDGPYNVVSRATDNAGNSEIAGAGITLNVDNSLPVSTITSPSDGAFLSSAAGISVSGTASDGGSDDITDLEISFDGGLTWVSVSGSKTSWNYTWDPESNGDYTILSRATDLAGNVEVPGPGVSVTVFDRNLTSPELVHVSWDSWLDGASCDVCHEVPTTFLPADFRERPAFCRSCHNATAPAHDRNLSGPVEHSVMVNVTSGGCRFPTYGNITASQYDNRLFANLYDGDKVACMTCHNMATKTEDIGRVWELTTTSDDRTYNLQNGGWADSGYYVPQVYRDTGLISAPTLVKDRKGYLVDESEYTYNEAAGTVTFSQAQDPSTYIYVTLDFPYLRASTYANRLCSDCHDQSTHMGSSCITCHVSHNTGNMAGIRELLRTTDQVELPVVFTGLTGTNSFADGDSTYDGICEVCHAVTLYHTRDGSGFSNHTGSGLNQAGTDCTSCHTHASGFAK